MARPLKARGAIQIQRARPAAELQKIQFLYNCPAPHGAARAALLACALQTQTGSRTQCTFARHINRLPVVASRAKFQRLRGSLLS